MAGTGPGPSIILVRNFLSRNFLFEDEGLLAFHQTGLQNPKIHCTRSNVKTKEKKQFLRTTSVKNKGLVWSCCTEAKVGLKYIPQGIPELQCNL